MGTADAYDMQPIGWWCGKGAAAHRLVRGGKGTADAQTRRLWASQDGKGIADAHDAQPASW